LCRLLIGQDPKPLQPRPRLFQLIGRQLPPAPLRRHIQAQVQVTPTARADLRGQVDGQGADDGVARLHLRHLQVRQPLVHHQPPAARPFDGTGVAGEEEGAAHRHQQASPRT
jgi:hypothetical protein